MRKLFNNVLKKYLLKGGDKKPPVVNCSVTDRVRRVNRELKEARLGFLGSITPHFERVLRRHQQRYRKNVTTALLYEDENLLRSMFYWHQSYHSNLTTPLYFLLSFVFLGTKRFFQKSLKGACTSLNCLNYDKVWKSKTLYEDRNTWPRITTLVRASKWGTTYLTN